MTSGKIVLLVFGIIGMLIGLALVIGGGATIWVDTEHVDSEGFITSDTIQIERSSRAIVMGSIDIDEDALDVLDWMGLVTDFKVEGSNNDPSKGIFIGVGEESDLEAYLNDVNHDEMDWSDIGWLDFDEVTYENKSGSSEPTAPTSETFWRVSAHGLATQTMEWETEAGSHSILLMNDDAATGVDLSAVFKVKVSEALIWVGLGLLIPGILALVIGSLMVFFAMPRSREPSAEVAPPSPEVNSAGNSSGDV